MPRSFEGVMSAPFGVVTPRSLFDIILAQRGSTFVATASPGFPLRENDESGSKFPPPLSIILAQRGSIYFVKSDPTVASMVICLLSGISL